MTEGNSMRYNRICCRTAVCLAAFFAVTFVIGTFFDEVIARAVFSGGNVPALIISTFGIYLFGAAYAFYFGAALSQAQKIIVALKRHLYSVVVLLLGTVTVIVCGGAILDINNLGGIFPQMQRSVPLIIAVFLVALLPIALIGFFLGRKIDDPMLGRRIVLMLNCMTVLFIIYESIKLGFPRPRFRLIQENIGGIGFHAWYDPIQNKNELIDAFSINADNFKSFPSGHTANAVMSITILPGLAMVIPGLRKRRPVLFITGIVIGFVVLASRMILGAHFLTDVSFGGFIASVMSAVYYKREGTIFVK